MSSPCQTPTRKQSRLVGTTSCSGFPDTLHRLLSIDHPRNAVAIDAHTKARRPERLLKRHLLFATFAESLEDALSLGCIFHVNGNVHASGFGVASRWAVRAHDVAIAEFQRRMHDQVL